MKGAKTDWDAWYESGAFAFMRKPAEQKRLACIARMIADAAASYGPCDVIDIGGGEGLLLAWLAPDSVATYVGVDISEIALSLIDPHGFTVKTQCSTLADFPGWDSDGRPVVVVASEVLNVTDDGVAQLRRAVAATPQAREVIISCVGPHPDKDNWTKASQRLWRQVALTGWQRMETLHPGDSQSGVSWDVARFRIAVAD